MKIIDQRHRFHWTLTLLICLCQSSLATKFAAGQPISDASASVLETSENRFLSNVRQIIFEGARSGEGYYSQDGSQLVFQSEREASNPFYQIYLQDLQTGDITRVSPGFGKTTCGWIHPDGLHVMYASTQFDPEILDKQKSEIEFRASGQTRRYSWDYDPQFDLVMWNRESGQYEQLTRALGYDAEGAISPDGQQIVFASNRRAYEGTLNDHENELFKIDPSSAMDIYLMDIDGSNVRRLTDTIGYDGGPFFSPDGSRICWRRFNEDGATAEIYTMANDGSDQRRITSLGVMSWAPYYHPSGDYLIFTTNVNGFANFELYAVDAAGKHEPVRVTTTDGFDGLPVFTPDGNALTWSTTRTASKKSQLFTATWNDSAMRSELGLSEPAKTTLPDANALLTKNANVSAKQNAAAARSSFDAADIGRHIDYLCRPELGGRLTGTAGEKAASAYVAAYMEQLGLEKVQLAGSPETSFVQKFPFVSRIEIGKNNELRWGTKTYEVDKQWRPLALTSDTEIQDTPIVFAGYGIVTPSATSDTNTNSESESALDTSEYDSYVHLDVQGKWVMVFRQMPMDISTQRRGYLSRFSSLRYKAMIARERGAVGIIFVSGPTSQARSELVSLSTDGSLSGSQIAAISIQDSLAEEWLSASGKSLQKLQSALDAGDMQMGFELNEVKLAAKIDVDPVEAFGQNTLGLLSCGNPDASTIIVGAHIDHLGAQAGNNSLAKEEEKNQVHRGADDNASGVAGMLEIAEYLSTQVNKQGAKLKANILFAAWSGEELGLLGSAYFIDNLPTILVDEVDPHAALHFNANSEEKVARKIAANINLDMIGRLRDNLVLQGTGSSPIWRSEIEKRNSIVGLSLILQDDSYLPTDASTFYIAGVPVLSAFTGQHSEYHTPRDVPELINFEGAARTAQLLGLITRSLALSGEVPEYKQQDAPENSGTRVNLTAYLGSIPDYAAGDIKGVKLSGVSEGGPAQKAGVKPNDIIVELASRKITNIYDYTYAIEALKIGEPTEIVVQRGDQELRLPITPASRQ